MSQDDRLIQIYEENPLLRFLIQIAGGVIPVVSAFDDALRTRIDNIQDERLRVFFDELDTGRIELTEEIIQSEDFLHAYFSTVKAALNTRRREKIRLFAQLFENYAIGFDTRSDDDYEEWLVLLDDISYREFAILMILYRYEQSNPIQEPGNELDWYAGFWSDFVGDVHAQLLIEPDELSSILARLTRTGLYGNIPHGESKIFGAAYLSSTAHLTPRFERFLEALGRLDIESS